LTRAFRRVEGISDRELMLLTGAFLWAFTGIATLIAGIVNPEIVPEPVQPVRIGCAVLAAAATVSILVWMPRLDDLRLMRWVNFWLAVASLLIAALMLGQPLNIGSLYIGLIAPVIFVACFMPLRPAVAQMVLISFCLLVPAAIGYDKVPDEHVLSRTVAFLPIIWVVAASIFLMKLSRQRAQRAVARIAETDPLTGVANLHHFERRGAELFDPRNARIAKPVGLLLIDLDDFKSINTRFGHAGGDLALREIGAALKGAELPSHLAARIGGDEFAVLIEDAVEGELAAHAEHYAAAIAGLRGSRLFESGWVRATIGSALAPRDGQTLDRLMEVADAALYANKPAQRAAGTEDAVDLQLDAAAPIRSAGGGHGQRRPQQLAPWSSRPLYSSLAGLAWLAATSIALIALAMPDAERGNLTYSLIAVASGFLIAIVVWIAPPPTGRWQWIRNDAVALLWIGICAALTGGAYSALWPLVLLFVAFEAWVLDSRRIWTRAPGAVIVTLAPLAYSDFSSISKTTGSALYAGALAVLGMTLVLSFLLDNRERAEEESERLTTIDPRTGLLNRREFERRADLALTAASAAESPNRFDVAVVMLDLDHFKGVNTEHGHTVGDELLAQIAATLADCTRVGDSLARIGGDEFAVLLLDVDRQTAEEIAERYIEAIDRSVANSHMIACRAVSATPGIALSGIDGSDLDQLLVCADEQLMASKAARPGRIVSPA
jgi:diguanylate cyclase (GGDEF)-like protein